MIPMWWHSVPCEVNGGNKDRGSMFVLVPPLSPERTESLALSSLSLILEMLYQRIL